MLWKGRFVESTITIITESGWLLKSRSLLILFMSCTKRLCQTLNKLKQTSVTDISFIRYYKWCRTLCEKRIVFFYSQMVSLTKHILIIRKKNVGTQIRKMKGSIFCLYNIVKFNLKLKHSNQIILLNQHSIVNMMWFHDVQNVQVCPFDKSQSFSGPWNNNKSSRCRIAYEIISNDFWPLSLCCVYVCVLFGEQFYGWR